MTLDIEGTEVLVLDGGLGTTLEDVFHKNISTPLWSAKPIDDDPETIIEAHLAFLRAGADMILTSTYQCAWETFERSGYTRPDAVRIMRRSVALAAEARKRYLLECTPDSSGNTAPRRVRIALSLGPYGSALPLAQEFGGFYPPPYGPKAYAPDGDNYNAFENWNSEQASIDALEAFHLERLRVFTQDTETWNAIDWVAFETVPLTREITAIRRAVGELGKDAEIQMKPWWIGTVYPSGKFPGEVSPHGNKSSIQEVVASAFRVYEGASIPRPPAFGINCTSVEFLPDLLKAATDIIQIVDEGRLKPFLVVYPNRGDVYDAANYSWLRGEMQRRGEIWAKHLCDIVRPVMERRAWGGLIIGGCCKTGPEEIAALAAAVKTEY